MKFAAVFLNVVTLLVTFSVARSAPLLRHLAEVTEEEPNELETNKNDRELIIDPRCYTWCLGFATGYCQKVYPRCAPLRRYLGEHELVVPPVEIAEEEPNALETANSKDRELIIDPRCYTWCLGFATGYCQKVYPRCAPL
jgi:hypothetical protein